jgi:ABC-2 type transport system ATP-binding protein
VGHPVSTLEELFLRVIEESKARPGRRYLPPVEDGARTSNGLAAKK